MSRAIDGAVLTEWISGECKSPSCPKNESAFGMRIMKHIDRMPTIEPERKKGKWIHDGYDFPHGNDWIHCSECGKRGINVPADLTNFCPNCGADMREGEQDGQT